MAALAMLYVAATTAAGALASSAACSRIAGGLAWVAPVTAFYNTQSLWGVLAATVLATSAARSVVHGGTALPSAQRRSIAMIAAAMCLQLALVFAFREMARPAVLLFGTAAGAIAWFRYTGDICEERSGGGWLGTAMAAWVFTALSLMPYLPPPKLTRTVPTPPEARAAVQPREQQQRPATPGAAAAPVDAYAGLILRPELKDYVTLVAPLTAKRTRSKPVTRNPDSIPFRGAYWLYRASAKTLPPGAAESRGDPASLSFRTSDFTPISMEARENFGKLFDLESCEAIEVEIANADRVPMSVSVELTVVNTRSPGKPAQSLGIVPVNSTTHWRPGDTGAAQNEVLRFTVPPAPAIRQFDEVNLRYVLRSPREIWSAKMSIERFRLIRRGSAARR